MSLPKYPKCGSEYVYEDGWKYASLPRMLLRMGRN